MKAAQQQPCSEEYFEINFRKKKRILLVISGAIVIFILQQSCYFVTSTINKGSQGQLSASENQALQLPSSIFKLCFPCLFQQIKTYSGYKNIDNQQPNFTLSDFYLNERISNAEAIVFLYSYDTEEGTAMRDLVRRTWLPLVQSRPNCLVLFFIGANGRKIKNNRIISSNNNETKEWIISLEQKVYQDIVLLDHVESYDELSVKMIKTYQWLARHQKNLFKKVRWYFKTDTDIYLNANAFFNMLDELQHTPLERALIGQLQLKAEVLREGSWKNLEWELDQYPPYVSGAGYWITRDVIEWIGMQADGNWLRTMPNEDTMLGIWIMGIQVEILKDQRVQAEGGNHEEKLDTIGKEFCADSFVVFHNLLPQAIEGAHQNMLDHGDPCPLKKKF